MSKRIGYLAQVFPHLSMTFVYREVMALREKGLDIHTFSTWKPKLEELSEEAKPLVDETYYVFPISWLRLLLCHISVFATRPWRYTTTLFFCLTREHKSFRNRLRTLIHFSYAIPLAQEVERRKIDHLHVHFALNGTTVAMIIARLTETTYSFTAHANDIFVNPILLPEKIAEARFIVAISDFNARYMYKILPSQETEQKMNVVRCGIDVERFAPPAYRNSKDRPMILAAGRLVEKKGIRYLLRACKLLVERGYVFDCTIIGGGPEEEELRRIVRELGLGDYVHLEGVFFQEDLDDYLLRADIVTLPCVVAKDNDMDGIPNSLMEGMAMELPSVSTTVSGIPELIEDMETGLLVPPEDEVALADALARLLDDHALRVSLGKAGRAKVAAEYEINTNTNRLVEVFRTYLGADLFPETENIL